MAAEGAQADGPDLIEAGRRLFARECEFYWAAAKKDGLPPPRGLEIAFAGRSNVGKSSLINALTGRNSLARTSHTPGRTQELNFFDVGGVFSIVDMPGYGFAAVGKEKVSAWTGLIHDYLRGRVQLGRVMLLIDARESFGAAAISREFQPAPQARFQAYRGSARFQLPCLQSKKARIATPRRD